MFRRDIHAIHGHAGVRRATLRVLVIALLAGSAAAFALTEALKLEPDPITVVRFDRVVSPSCRCARKTARFAIRLRTADAIDASILAAGGEKVRVVAEGLARPAGVVRFTWNGRDEAGRIAPDGRYRLRIHLREQERTIVIRKTVRVATA